MNLPVNLSGLVRPDAVHRRLYTDPAVFDREMTRVFGGTWTYLGHTSEIPQAGDFRRRTLGRRPILLVRGADGEVRALFNRCAHRGTLLVAEDSGCASSFTCPYHGWRYGSNGRLRNIPVPSSYEDIHSGRFDLGRVAVAEHRGFLFGTLAADPAPLAEHLGPVLPYLDQLVDRHPGGRLRVLPTPVRYEFGANWKVSWDNAADGLHATFAHRSYNLLGKAADTETVLARNPAATPMISRALTGGHSVVDQRPGIPDGPWATMRPMPTSEELVASLRSRGEEGTLDLATGSMLNVNVFPNLIFVGNQLLVVEPLAVDRTRITLHLVGAPGAPEEIDLLRLRVDEDFVSFGTPDDLEMFERIQEGLAIEEDEWIDTSRGAAFEVAGQGRESVTRAGELHAEIVGDIDTEAPVRGYLREWTRLMTDDRPLVPRRGPRPDPLEDAVSDAADNNTAHNDAADNKKLVRTYHERLWRDGDASAIDDFWSPAAVVHMTGFDGTAVDVVREDVARYQGAFTGVETSILDLLGDGDRVVLRWETSGDHVGPYDTVAPTGKRITMSGVDVLRIADGRIVECWSLWDGMAVYAQFGLLPEELT